MRWFALLKEDFMIVKERDPSIHSNLEIFTLHTGFWAVVFYRMQHALWDIGLRWLARFFSVISRFITGVEFHPAVTAGRRLFIDHGMGIVIGETAELGDDVSIYQGVTLGGTSWKKTKRHPTIGNNVILGAGAKVIGAINLADNVRVGSNAVVIKDVAAHTTVVGIPAKPIVTKSRECEVFEAYAQSENSDDPIMRAIEGLNQRITDLESENQLLKQKINEKNNG